MSPLVIGIFIILIYGPYLWVKFTFWRYNDQLSEIPGTGEELARHLIKRFELTDVAVEEGDQAQNHFSPGEKMVRLSPEIYQGKSLTAIAIAAHEVGHAIQFHRNEPTCRLYTQYFPIARRVQRIGIGMISLPIFSLALAAPKISILALSLVAVVMIASAIIHLIVLPQEWDASFNKAMPILDLIP